MLRFLTAVAFTTFLLMSAQAGDNKNLDPAKLVGDWACESGQKDGKKIEADKMPKKVTFTKDTLAMTIDGNEFIFGYKIDAKTTPAKFDMTIKKSPFGPDEKVTPGLIQIEGKKLTFCYVPMTDKRPTKLESTADNNVRVFVLKKIDK